eukprot:scaffold343004_cov71-Attheya_sp.AAC.1
MLLSTATGPNSVATLTEASSMVGASASWMIEGSGDAVSVGGEFEMADGCYPSIVGCFMVVGS